MKHAPKLRIVNLDAEKTDEVDEPTCYASDLENAAGLQDFDAQLLHETATLEVQVPRGLRTHGSAALAGQLRSGCAHPMPVPIKRYEVTVEPGANERKPKDFIREYWRPFSEFEFDVLQSREDAPELNAQLDPRLVFRSERQTSFQATRRFPALVSPRILPAWRRAETSAGSAAVKGKRLGSTALKNRRGTTVSMKAYWANSKKDHSPRGALTPSSSSERVFAETSSKSVKRRAKMQLPEEDRRWLPVHTLDSQLEQRSPALFVDEYEAPRNVKRLEALRSRERQMSETDMLPPSRARSRSQEELQFESAMTRHWGRVENERLKVRYQKRTNKIRKQATAEWRRSIKELRESFRRDDSEERLGAENRETTKSPDPVAFLAGRIKGRFNDVTAAGPEPPVSAPSSPPISPRSRRGAVEMPRRKSGRSSRSSRSSTSGRSARKSGGADMFRFDSQSSRGSQATGDSSNEAEADEDEMWDPSALASPSAIQEATGS